MAQKKAKTEGINGVDRFTSNGYGIVTGKQSAKKRKEIDALNKELSKAKKKGSK